MHDKRRTTGLVLGVEDAGEADRVFSVFAREFGLIELRGRAIRKMQSKLRSGIELFSLGRMEFVQGKNRKTLTDAALVAPWRPRSECAAAALASGKRISELTVRLIRGQEPDERVLALLQEVFGGLQDFTGDVRLAEWSFFWRFVSLLGYAPQLFACLACRRKLQPYGLRFSARDGGIFCKSCAGGETALLPVGSATVKALRLLAQENLATVRRLRLGYALADALGRVTGEYERHLVQTIA